jgi:hypothetical protein
MQPIVASFDIKALSPDSNGVVIDATDLLNGDNELIYFDNATKRTLGISGMQSDKSYLNNVKNIPGNIEINAIKTYGRMSGQGPGSSQSGLHMLPSS